MLFFDPGPTRFVTHFLLMMHTFCLKNALRGTVNLQDFIVLKLSKEEGTVSMIKDDQSFFQTHIFIKMENPLLILLRISDSNQPHMDKLRFIFLMFGYHISMSMPELND